MSRLRFIPAAIVFVALTPAGHAVGEALERGHNPASLDNAVSSVSHHAPEAPPPGLSVFSLTRFRQPIAPGSSGTLAPQGLTPPGDTARTSGIAPRRELGIHYSSDGRLSGYLATTDPTTQQAGTAECCAAAGSAPDVRFAATKHYEDPAVTSLMGQLRKRGLKLRLDDGWQITSGARSRQYAGTGLSSRIGHITLGRWWGNVNTSYSMQVEKRGSSTFAPSQALRVGYAFTPASSVALAYTTGQEIAFFGERGLLKTEVRSLALHAEHSLKKEWSLTFDAGYYDHGELPGQKAIRVAFRRNL